MDETISTNDQNRTLSDDLLSENSSGITLGMIISELLAVRWYMVLFPIFLGLSFAGVFLVTSIFTLPPVVHFVDLKLKNGRYPNGVAFSPNDFKLPEVLKKLNNKYNVGSIKKLDDGILVSFDSPSSLGITKKYRSLLSQRGLSAAELDDINKKFSEELDASTAGSVRIEISRQELGISAQAAKNLAIALPLFWAEVMATDYSVLHDTGLNQIALGTLGALRTPAEIYVTDRALNQMRSGLEIIKEDIRLKHLSIDGRTAYDLIAGVQNYRLAMFEPIYHSTSRATDIVTIAHIKNTKNSIREANAELKGLDTVLEELRFLFQPDSMSVRQNDTVTSGSAIQLNSAGISEIIAMERKSALSEYLEKTFDQRQNLVKRREVLITRLARLSDRDDTVLSASYLEAAEKKIAEIAMDYNKLLTAAKNKLGSEFGSLYVPAGTPTAQSAFDLVALAIMVVAGILLGLSIVMFIALFVLFVSRSKQKLQSV